MKFLKDGLSIDEFKASSLVIVFVMFSIVAIYSYISTGDITSNWLELLMTLIYVIGGVNAVKGLIDSRKKISETIKVDSEPVIEEKEDYYSESDYDKRI